MAGQPMPYAANYNYANQGYGGYQQVYEQQYAPGQVCQPNRHELCTQSRFEETVLSFGEYSLHIFSGR